MIDGTFKYFIELHKENLKEIFYPIKLFLTKCENQNKNLIFFIAFILKKFLFKITLDFLFRSHYIHFSQSIIF